MPGLPVSANVAQRSLDTCFLGGLNDSSGNLVGIRVGGRATVFQAALPAVFDSAYRDTDRRTAVRYTVTELFNGLRLVLTCQALVVVDMIPVVDGQKTLVQLLD